MVDKQQKIAGLMQLMRVQATQLLSQCESLQNGEGLTLSKEQKGDFSLETAISDLQRFEKNDKMSDDEFKEAHKRIQEIQPRVKQIIASLSADQKKKFDKKSEKKISKAQISTQERLQKQLDEVTAQMADQQKMHLNQMMQRMPQHKQEQLIAELSAQAEYKKSLTPEQRQKEDAESMATQTKFNTMMQSLDHQQQQIVMQKLASMMPSGQMQYMKQLVEGGVDQLIPPSAEELKEWKSLYLSYFNANFSVKQGRRLPKYLCVKNPRPDEVIAALNSFGLKNVFEANKKHPADFFNGGRIKFRLFDTLGNLCNDKYKSKNQVMRMVGEFISASNTRTDDILALEKEKEGVFDMARDEAMIAQQMQQLHGAMGVPQQQTQQTIKVDKKKKRR